MTRGTPTALAQLFRRAALPLGCYYVVTLALPLANVAAQSGAAFVSHALAVLVVPPIVMVFACAIGRVAHVCVSAAARLRRPIRFAGRPSSSPGRDPANTISWK